MILVDSIDSEGHVINRPSFFKGEKIKLCKLKMMDFLEYCNGDLLKIIETDIPSLLDAIGN